MKKERKRELQESATALCAVFNGEKEFTKRELSGESAGIRYLFFWAREEERDGWWENGSINGQLAKKRRWKGGKKNDCHEIKKNEWLYLSVIKTVPKNKQTRGNKPRARLQTRHSCCAPQNSNKRLRQIKHTNLRGSSSANSYIRFSCSLYIERLST